MQLLVNGLIAGSLAALIAGGLALVYGTLGVFNLALGQMVLCGGYATWWLHQSVGLPFSMSILGGLVFGILLSWLTFTVFIQPFYKRHRFLPLVTTISLSMILDALILLLFGERPKSILPGEKRMIQLFGARISTEQITLILVAVLLLILFAYILHSTPFGRRVRAVVQNDFAAMSLGIRAFALHRFIFILSGVLAACAGIFIGIDQNLTPLLAFPLTIKAYAAVIAGGKGNFWGAVFCAYLIAFLEQLIIGVHWFGMFFVPSGFQDTVALLFIITFLLFRPVGIFGSQTRSA
jgi:branched-subunit amino acid ABC-type transport system permease component